MRARHFIFILSVSALVSMAAYGVWLITSSRGATAHTNLVTRNASQTEEMLLRAAQTEPRLCPKSDGTKLKESPDTHHHKVILTWNASANDPRHEVVGYCLYRIVKKKNQPKWGEKCKNCEQVNEKPIDGTACVDDVVQDGVKYYYVAMAIDQYGHISSLSNDALAEIPSTADVKGPAKATSYPRCRKDNQLQ